MKAMVLKTYSEPLGLEEIPVPHVGTNDVLIKIEACGICGTDLKISKGILPGTKIPLVMGHEPAGTIVETGKEVKGLAAGDHVCIHFYVTCGSCYYCKTGQDSLCTNLVGQIGFHLNGGFAEYLVVPAKNCIKVPNQVDFKYAAILGDAVATSYHALVRKAEVKPGQKVLVMGSGGVGLHAVQIAKLMGAYTIAVDINIKKLEHAINVGADSVVLFNKDNFVASVKNITKYHGVDVVIETVGIPLTSELCLQLLNRGGKLIIIGYKPGESINYDALYLLNNEISILGSRASSKAELEVVVDLAAHEKIKPIVTKEFALAEVNEALAFLKKGEIVSRAVLIP